MQAVVEPPPSVVGDASRWRGLARWYYLGSTGWDARPADARTPSRYRRDRWTWGSTSEVGDLVGQPSKLWRSRMRRSLPGCAAAVVLAASLQVASTPDALAAPDGDTSADAADTGDGADDDSDGALRVMQQAADAARDAFNAARKAEATARAAGRTADGRVRDAEEVTVMAVLERLEMQGRVAEARAAMVRADRRLDSARRMVVERRNDMKTARLYLDEARAEFEDRVVRAYKAGSLAGGSTFAITLARESRSPGELATMVKHLETLALVGDDRLGDAITGLADAEAALADAHARHAAAEVAVTQARVRVESALSALERVVGEVDDAEARVGSAREAANGAEARVLTAVARRLDAEASLETARGALADHEAAVRAADAAEAASGGATDDGAGLAERQGWLAARERAHRRVQALPAERRRTDDGWVCPVEGASFANDWGFPRSSDRRHEGTDVFAPLGTDILAPVAGEVVRADRSDGYDGRGDLGGITVSIQAGAARFYLAHLDSIHPDIHVGDTVAAGDVIGFVGSSGNARGTPAHLHLGWYVEGVPVNPYPSLAVACSSSR